MVETAGVAGGSRPDHNFRIVIGSALFAGVQGGQTRRPAVDHVRPVLFHPRPAVCNQPWVKGMTQMVNGIYNGSRFEDVWLDK